MAAIFDDDDFIPYYDYIREMYSGQSIDEPYTTDPSQFAWSGMIDDNPICDLFNLMEALIDRDHKPTRIVGLFGNPKIARTLDPPFDHYNVTHDGIFYLRYNFRIDTRGHILPQYILPTAPDITRYIKVTLYNKVNYPFHLYVHNLLGMTYCPPTQHPERRIYHHLDGDVNFNHIQNIGYIDV